jgi:hypothetical protein
MNIFRLGRTVTASAAMILLGSAGVLAGTKTSFPVFVDDVAMTAAGSLGSTRNTADTSSLLGCEVESDNSGNGSFGFCSARNAAGTIGVCSTSSPELVAAMRSLNGDSFLEFEWDANGNCTFIEIDNGADLAPK